MAVSIGTGPAPRTRTPRTARIRLVFRAVVAAVGLSQPDGTARARGLVRRFADEEAARLGRARSTRAALGTNPEAKTGAANSQCAAGQRARRRRSAILPADCRLGSDERRGRPASSEISTSTTSGARGSTRHAHAIARAVPQASRARRVRARRTARSPATRAFERLRSKLGTILHRLAAGDRHGRTVRALAAAALGRSLPATRKRATANSTQYGQGRAHLRTLPRPAAPLNRLANRADRREGFAAASARDRGRCGCRRPGQTRQGGRDLLRGYFR